MKFLPEIFGKEIYYIDMKKSYRSTCEIMKYAQSVFQREDQTEYVERHGEKPQIEPCDSERERTEKLVRDIGKDGKYQTRGVLCLTQEDADRIHETLKEWGIETDLLTKDSMRFQSGISVMPFYLAKGLEFDVVYIPGVEKYQSPLAKQALYINVTRALHKLRLYQ